MYIQYVNAVNSTAYSFVPFLQLKTYNHVVPSMIYFILYLFSYQLTDQP